MVGTAVAVCGNVEAVEHGRPGIAARRRLVIIESPQAAPGFYGDALELHDAAESVLDGPSAIELDDGLEGHAGHIEPQARRRRIVTTSTAARAEVETIDAESDVEAGAAEGGEGDRVASHDQSLTPRPERWQVRRSASPHQADPSAGARLANGRQAHEPTNDRQAHEPTNDRQAEKAANVAMLRGFFGAFEQRITPRDPFGSSAAGNADRSTHEPAPHAGRELG